MNDVGTVENRRCKFVNVVQEKVLLIRNVGQDRKIVPCQRYRNPDQ